MAMVLRSLLTTLNRIHVLILTVAHRITSNVASLVGVYNKAFAGPEFLTGPHVDEQIDASVPSLCHRGCRGTRTQYGIL